MGALPFDVGLNETFQMEFPTCLCHTRRAKHLQIVTLSEIRFHWAYFAWSAGFPESRLELLFKSVKLTFSFCDKW